MLEELNPVEMIEPGTGRHCHVRGNDVEAYERAGYRRTDAASVEPEATAAEPEEATVAEDTATEDAEETAEPEAPAEKPRRRGR